MPIHDKKQQHNALRDGEGRFSLGWRELDFKARGLLETRWMHSRERPSALKRLLHAAPTVLVHPAADVSLIPLRRIRIVTTMRCFRWSTCTWKRAFHA